MDIDWEYFVQLGALWKDVEHLAVRLELEVWSLALKGQKIPLDVDYRTLAALLMEYCDEPDTSRTGGPRTTGTSEAHPGGGVRPYDQLAVAAHAQGLGADRKRA